MGTRCRQFNSSPLRSQKGSHLTQGSQQQARKIKGLQSQLDRLTQELRRANSRSPLALRVRSRDDAQDLTRLLRWSFVFFLSSLSTRGAASAVSSVDGLLRLLLFAVTSCGSPQSTACGPVRRVRVLPIQADCFSSRSSLGKLAATVQLRGAFCLIPQGRKKCWSGQGQHLFGSLFVLQRILIPKEPMVRVAWLR